METCTHYYQNESSQGEIQTENYWNSRRKGICYATTTLPLEQQSQRFIQTMSC